MVDHLQRVYELDTRQVWWKGERGRRYTQQRDHRRCGINIFFFYGWSITQLSETCQSMFS